MVVYDSILHDKYIISNYNYNADKQAQSLLEKSTAERALIAAMNSREAVRVSTLFLGLSF